jgi:integrase
MNYEESDSEFYYPEVEKETETEQHNMAEAATYGDEIISNSQEELQRFVQEQKSANTVKKTSSDMKCFYRYLEDINKKDIQILNLPPNELDHLLGKFFKDVKKINGEEYEPSSLTGLQRSIQRFLSDSGSKINILKDDEFAFSRKVLEAKRKNLVVQGKGNRPNATRSLTNEEENKLYESGAFGAQNPESLQRTMWWILSLHFGFRARDESRKLCWGDVSLQTDPSQDGREMLVWLNERGTKTRKGEENGHRRPFSPKAYATNTERCPVMYYKLFQSHRPEEMKKPESPFFLAVRHGDRRVNPEIWYKKSPIGKNEIGKFLKTAADEASLHRDGSKVTNHSVRKTSISRLLDANTPENFVAQLSGHKNLQSLQSYKSASENHQRQMSYILSGEIQNNHQITQASTNSQQSLSSNQLSLRQTNSLAVNNASSPTALDSIFSGANISSISGCQFQIFKGPIKMTQQGNKRRSIIESDDED